MLQLVASIIVIAGIATLIAISGILVLTDSWSPNYDTAETSNSSPENTLEFEMDANISSSNNPIQDGDDQSSQNKFPLSTTPLSLGLALTNNNGLNAVKVYSYSHQVTVLYNLYAQSALLNHKNGVRAPPCLI